MSGMERQIAELSAREESSSIISKDSKKKVRPSPAQPSPAQPRHDEQLTIEISPRGRLLYP